MSGWQEVGALTNAAWCDRVVRAHGGDGAFEPDAWTSSRRTPPLYPDAVTLIPSSAVRSLLGRIDGRLGCTIKDSFASLDLSSEGFGVLFDATWVASPGSAGRQSRLPRGWIRVLDPQGVGAWEDAWCGQGGLRGILLPSLLAVGTAFLGRCEEGRIVAGGMLHGHEGIVGVSNVFTEVGLASETWSALVRCASALFPGWPLVGYEQDDELSHALAAGFHAAGSLRVWVAER